jgi:chromosome segregation ATPase
MATTKNEVSAEIEELQNRLDWLDKERLKASRRATTLEQRQTTYERQLETRDQRIKELEAKLAAAVVQISRATQIDSELKLLKDEMLNLVEQYDKRGVNGQEEIEKLRRVEHEMYQREIAAIKKEIKPIGRLENEMALRPAEEQRLAGLVGTQKSKIDSITSEVANWPQQLSFVIEAERANAKSIADLHTGSVESLRKLESVDTRLEVVNHNQMKAQTSIQELIDSLAEVRREAKLWVDQVQLGEHQRNKRLDEWQATIDGFQEQMNSYTTEWVKYNTQYQESKMAVQTLVEWQSRIESQQQETAEMSRIAANQLLSRWASFQVENDKRWKNYELDREQRWARSDRKEKKVLAQLQEISELLDDIEQEKDALWRVQNAQADVMKSLPRIWKEEVEKARAHNPNSRRQPALVPVREE